MAPVHHLTEFFDLPPHVRTLKVGPKCLQVVTPAGSILPNDRALFRALSDTLGFAEIDLLSETGAHVPARVSHQRPADGRRALAVVVYVLLGHVGIVPDDLLFESTCRGVVVDLLDL